MKTDAVQLEILLMTNTTFSKQQWCPKDISEEHRPYLVAEQMEEACWNGSLEDMLPGIIEKSDSGKKLFLWQIKHQNACLEMELGEYPKAIDPRYSIDAYHFLAIQYYN